MNNKNIVFNILLTAITIALAACSTNKIPIKNNDNELYNCPKYIDEVGTRSHREYFTKVYSKISNNFNLPEKPYNGIKWDQSLRATMIATVTENGEITEIKVEKKSGNKEFDKYVIKAIEKSNPLPPPNVFNQTCLDIGLVFKPQKQ